MLADPLRSDELGDNELAGPPFAAVLRLSDVAVPQFRALIVPALM
jgi:hypothetical protein